MKKITVRILGLVLSGVMLLGLTSCGKKDPNLIKLKDFEILYKSACIMEDYSGADALVVTMDFTNNSKESTTYIWSIYETCTQDGVDLMYGTVFTDPENYEEVADGQFAEVAPGATAEVKTCYLLNDTTSKVEMSFSQLFDSKSGKITIDPATLSRESAAGGAAISTLDDSAVLDWWNGDWYGWWVMTGCSGYYAEQDMEGSWWDICGTIDIGEDFMGTVMLWDTDYTASNPMVSASVSLSRDGVGDYGTLMSEGGYFTNIDLEHADWIVDPGLSEVPGLLHISGYYEDGSDQYSYNIYLRPWGAYWDDVEEDFLPYFYDDWYLPMIEGGKSMPDAIGTDAPSGSGNTGASTAGPSSAVSGGDGIVSQEQVEKGYVWMSEVAKDIYHTTYEELVDYFGVEGEFVEEEYSDHMQENRRYYKWISSENPNHFIYVNFAEREPGVFVVCAFNTSGFSGSEAKTKYLDIVKAEAAEVDKAAAANMVMKDFSIEVKDPVSGKVIKIFTTLPESGWSTKKDTIVENNDPDAFGAGAIRFKLRESMEKLDSYKDSYENFQEGPDRVIGGVTFKSRTFSYIGYDWIEYVGQIDDGRFLSIGLTDLDCFEGTVPDIILNNMQFQ